MKRFITTVCIIAAILLAMAFLPTDNPIAQALYRVF
jgi:hypothetical protein